MAEEKKRFRKIYIALFLLLLHLNLFSIAYAGNVVVKPGKFDHFTLQMPDKSVAGENFVIKASIYDSNNNLITNFSESGKDFKVDVSGSATVQPAILNAASFSGGTANIIVNDKKSEKITFSIREASGSVAVISREIIVTPNKLDHFNVQSPHSVVAGSVFEIKIVAKDMFDNIVQDLDIGKNLKITTSGVSSVKVASAGAINFINGVATVGFTAEKTGDVIVDIQDINSGSKGKTSSISVMPAALSYFRLLSPETAVAGEPFEVVVAAYDAFGNIVTNYSAIGAGIKLISTGSSKIEPPVVNASEFRNGQVSVTAFYEKAEDIQIIAHELNREQTGKTSLIKISNTDPDHFVVITPDMAVSGQTFKIRVEAYDRFNNIVKDFNLRGGEVQLTTSGNGTLTPSKVSPSDFIGGIAVADVMYDRAESFQISAHMVVEKAKGRMTVNKSEDLKVEKIVPVKTKQKSVSPAENDVKPNAEHKHTKQQAKPKPRSAGNASAVDKEKVGTKSELPKKLPPKDVKEQEKPQASTSQPTVKKDRLSDKSNDLEKASDVAIKDDKKADKTSHIYTVSKVSIIEAKNKAMLVINVTNPNGHLEYTDEIESRYGKEWLKLKIRPALNATDKSFKFKSAYIGEVRIEEDKTAGNNIVNLYIELIPSGITYDIARVKNTLVITMANP